MIEKKDLKIRRVYYNIRDFGAAVCDRPQTESIQKAIDTCFSDGGGIVVIPKGVFLTGGLRLRSGIELHLEAGAILEGSGDPEDYTGYINDEIEPFSVDEKNAPKDKLVNKFSRWNNAMLRAINASDIAITGEAGSIIDGADCFDALGEEGYRGPHAINMYNCKNIYFEGYTIINCANWAHAIFESENITAKNLSVFKGHDGFDVRTCDNVRIENCEFRTGDDCIAGFDNNDVVIRNCIFDSSCSALRFGGNNVLVENCRSYAPASFGHRYAVHTDDQKITIPAYEDCRHNMLTAFLYYCDFRAEIRKTPGDILIRNCTFENPDRIFNLEFDGEHKWCCNRSLSSIKFENCVFSNVCEPIHIHGDEREKLTLELCNVSISAKKGCENMPLADAVNFEKIILSSVRTEGFDKPDIKTGSGNTVYEYNGEDCIITENPTLP